MLWAAPAHTSYALRLCAKATLRLLAAVCKVALPASTQRRRAMADTTRQRVVCDMSCVRRILHRVHVACLRQCLPAQCKSVVLIGMRGDVRTVHGFNLLQKCRLILCEGNRARLLPCTTDNITLHWSIAASAVLLSCRAAPVLQRLRSCLDAL